MYGIITLNWFFCQLLYRIGKKKMSHRNYATNSQWRECFEKGKKVYLSLWHHAGSYPNNWFTIDNFNMFHSWNAEKHVLISSLQWLAGNLGHTVPIFRKIAIWRCFGAKSQENLIWCAFYGLESAYTDLLYSVKQNECTQKALSIEM